MIPVGARVLAKFQKDGMWYVGHVGSVHGRVLDAEIVYGILFDRGDVGTQVQKEHVRLLEQQVSC